MSVSTTGGRSTVGCARGSSRTTNRKPRLGRAAAAAATAWTALLTARAGFLDSCPLDSAMVLVGGSAATRCFSPRHGSRRLQKKKSTRPTTIWVWGGGGCYTWGEDEDAGKTYEKYETFALRGVSSGYE